MEWVEITARTLEEARDRALDTLGVDEQDAEIEVVEEPRPGLFGRLRGQARVRARVRPTRPRPKAERERRRRRGEGDGGAGGGRQSDAATADSPDSPNQTNDRSGGSRRSRRGGRGGGQRAPRPSPTGAPAGARTASNEGNDMPDLSIDEQATIVGSFLTGLADAFGTSGTSTIERVDDETVEIRLDGDELGLLIGPKGQTLQAIQELARTTVQRRGGGTQEGRIRIDVAGYRQRRREALERFTRQVAEEVVASGAQKALEAMNPADRKVVHDTVNDIAGVRTVSEGEEPRRRVVLLPDVEVAPAPAAADSDTESDTDADD